MSQNVLQAWVIFRKSLNLLQNRLTMKAHRIFKQYIWLTDVIYRAGRITYQEINRRWTKTDLSQNQPMNRATFTRYKNAIEELFNLNIECDRKTNEYYIENKEILKNNTLQYWILDSLSVSNTLMESLSMNERILLENIPSGKEYLSLIINAMKQGNKLVMEYHKFGSTTGHHVEVEPYAIKVFKQRWYLLANDGKKEKPAVYALDRVVSLKESTETFQYPQDCNAKSFFKDCYGVIYGTNDVAQRIVLRAYPPYINYIRTLPLHTSQKELESTDKYADFAYFLRPTFDFKQELLSQADEVEVLEPLSLREEMKAILQRMLKRYS